MLRLALEQVKASPVRFQIGDCRRTSLPAETFDTAFMSLVIHFTDPEKTLAEVRRILKPGGTLIISNLDVDALRGLDLIRCQIRVIYRGLTGYRMKPPKGVGNAGEATLRSVWQIQIQDSQRRNRQRYVPLFGHPSSIYQSCKSLSRHARPIGRAGSRETRFRERYGHAL
jgi:ubiquinone/menaquinone biosynthesis C-methylase UbiE